MPPSPRPTPGWRPRAAGGGRPPGPAPARQAQNPGQAAVQFGHLGRAGRLVQAVHVLGDDPGPQPAAAELGERSMTRVRPLLGYVPPAEVAAGPVPAPGGRAPGEGLVS